MRQAARVYFETQVTTTSPGQILIMLYDGAIKFLNQAKERIEAKDYAGKGKLISSAIDVINELTSSLNAEKGGDLAANLHQLYFYCNKRLFMANSRMDTAAVDEVIKILSGIRSAYAQIVDTPEAQAAMAASPVAPGKPLRAPSGMGAGPVGNAPVATAKAHNAYASMGAARNPEAEPDIPALETVSTEAHMPVSEATPEPAGGVRDPEAAAPETTAPEMPSFDVPPSFDAHKRAAASTLYRKFSS